MRNNNGIAASLYSSDSGIKLDIKTTYPVIVFYSNNYPEYDVMMYDGINDDMRMAVCLECQYSPNGLKFMPENCGIFDKKYNELIVYEFSYK